jgi:hypothetical protein
MITLHSTNVLEKLRETIDQHGGDGVRYQQRAKELGMPTRPDGTKTSCIYVYGNKPACLIGCLMVDLGLSIETIEPDLNYSVGVTTLLRRLSAKGVIETDEATVRVLETAQDAQDRDLSWGEAYKAAEATLQDLNTLAGLSH